MAAHTSENCLVSVSMSAVQEAAQEMAEAALLRT